MRKASEKQKEEFTLKIRKVTAVLLSAAALTAAMPVAPFTGDMMQNTTITAEAATTTSITSGSLCYDIISNGGDKYAVVTRPTSSYVSSVSIPGSVSGGGHYNVPVRKIGYGAFAGCSNLSSVNLTGTYYLVEIGGLAFASCGNLRNFTIPNWVTTIGANAFEGVTMPSTVNIGANLTNIDPAAFVNTRGVTQFSVASGNPNYKSVSGVLYTKNGNTLLRYPDKKSSTSFTTSAAYIANDAISYNTNLKTLSFSNLLRSGAEKIVFSGLTSLENITIPQADFNQSVGTIMDRYSPMLTNGKINKINGQTIVTVASNGMPSFGSKFNSYVRNNFELYQGYYFMDYYVDKMATYVVNTVTNSSMTQWTKAEKLHDWILNNTTYDPRVAEALRLRKQHILIPEADYATDKNHVNASVFLHQRNGVKYTVCDGYSRCYKILLNKAGIECDYVYGTDLTETNSQYRCDHAWNRVKINGTYYFTDVTWDDSNYDSGNTSNKYKYFMKSEYWFRSNAGGHGTYDWQYWTVI